MKVLHLVKTEIGAHWACRQIEVLQKHGVEVTVVLPGSRGGIIEKYRKSGASVIEENLNFPAKEIWRLPSILKRMELLVNEVKPDIIHSHFVGTTYIMRIALGKSHPIPRVFQIPGPLHLEKGPYGYIDKALSGKNDYWIGSCEWTSKRYIEMGIEKEKVFNSYYGTDLSTYKVNPKGKLRTELKIAADVPIVGMVAYMYPPKRFLGQKVGLKGHEDFIDAIQILKKNIPEVKGVIVGGPWGQAVNYEARLHNLAKEKCGDSIIFTGFRGDIAEIYPDFNLVAHPSHSENLGGAAESLLLNIPTIATNIGGFPDIIKDGVTGWLVPPKSPAKLAAAMLYVLNNDTEAKVCSSKGMELAISLLDVEKTGQEIVRIYEIILAGQKFIK